MNMSAEPSPDFVIYSIIMFWCKNKHAIIALEQTLLSVSVNILFQQEIDLTHRQTLFTQLLGSLHVSIQVAS